MSYAIEDFGSVVLDGDALEVHRAYMERYYNASFIPGQGTEKLVGLLGRYAKGGDWLDIGSGTTALYWSLPMQNPIRSLTVSDISPEALMLLKEQVNEARFPPCYQDTLVQFGLNRLAYESTLTSPKRYLVFNALEVWPASLLSPNGYDQITTFGVFGISKDRRQFDECFSNLRTHLRPGGICIGASWHRTRKRAAQTASNDYLVPEAVSGAASSYGLKILEVRREEISGDPDYDYLVSWSLARPEISSSSKA